MLNERARLALQQDTRLQALQPVPDVLGNVHTITATFLTDDTGFHYLALVIVGCHTHFALQNHKGLVLVGMVMYRNKCAWFQGIKESVALVLQTLMKVVVLPQSWRLLGFLGQSVH